MAPEGQKRRFPKQERSRRRYEAIVDAAAELFATVGFDATTMEAIAGAAETSIGSVYRFFPDKRALFRAVAERALERVAATFAAVGASEPEPELWHRRLDRAVDGLAALHERDPSARALLVNMQLHEEYAEADEALLRQFIAASAAILASWAPALEPDQRDVIARTLVHSVTGMLVFAHGEPAATRAAMREHCKLMLRRYLEPWIPVPSPS